MKSHAIGCVLCLGAVAYWAEQGSVVMSVIAAVGAVGWSVGAALRWADES